MTTTEALKPKQADIKNAMVLHAVIVRWVENDVVDKTRKSLTTCWNKLWRTRADERRAKAEELVAEAIGKIAKTIDDATTGLITFSVKDLRRVLVRYRSEAVEPTEQELIRATLEKYQLHGMDWLVRLRSYGSVLAARILDVISSGIIEGLSVAEMVRRLRKDFGLARTDAERVARTETMFASNLAALETYSSMGDVVAGVEFVATMDSRTCPVCGGFDGQEFYYSPDVMKGQKSISECPQPPLHPLCRCFTAPVAKSWQELGFKTKSSAPKAAASANLKFPDWLAQQPEKVQRRVMGAYFDLYKLGGYDVAHKALLAKIPIDKLGSEWKELWTQSQAQIEPFKLNLPTGTVTPKVRRK